MNPLILVYRVECPTCTNGPYNCICLQWQHKKSEFESRHKTDFFLSARPGMGIDFPLGRNRRMDDYYSGFKNRGQMLQWFEGTEFSLFRANGFKLAVYIAKYWVEGYSKNQIFCIRPNRWRMMELPVAGL